MPVVLAVVPARGGSKGIPRKNIRPFLGRPLIAWTVQVAIESGVCDKIVLSTDDEEIASVGATAGAEVPFLRPAALAQDTTPTAPAIQHAIAWLGQHVGFHPDLVLVLEPTSPLRQPFHVRDAVECFADSRIDTVVTVSEVPHHYVPSKQLALHPDGTITGVDGRHVRDMTHRRQDLPASYAFDGLIFACRTPLLLQDPPTLWGDVVHGQVVDPQYGADLDTPQDWAAAEVRLRELLLKETL